MTLNEMRWLSHFLRRVVTHDPTEQEMLVRLVTRIEQQLNAPKQRTQATVAPGE